MEVQKKIDKGEIRIENGRLIGLGDLEGSESIDIASLNELIGRLEKDEIARSLFDIISRLGALTSILYREKENIPDFNGLISINIPHPDELFVLRSVYEFFNESIEL